MINGPSHMAHETFERVIYERDRWRIRALNAEAMTEDAQRSANKLHHDRDWLRETLEMLANWHFGGRLAKQRMQEIARAALQEAGNE